MGEDLCPTYGLNNFYKNIYFQEIPSKSFKKKYSQDEIKFNELNFKLANLFFKKISIKTRCFPVFPSFSVA